MIRQATIQKFTEAFPNFAVAAEGNQIVLSCNDCQEGQRHLVRVLTRRLSKGFRTQCESAQCKPVHVTGGFTHLGFRNLCSDACGLTYFLDQQDRYIVCFCAIKTKITERVLFTALNEQGYERLSRESYWRPELTRHKCDILIHLEHRKVYIEVDDRSHNTTIAREKDAAFNALFLEHRIDSEYLLRVVATELSSPDYLEQIYQAIEDPDEGVTLL